MTKYRRRRTASHCPAAQAATCTPYLAQPTVPSYFADRAICDLRSVQVSYASRSKYVAVRRFHPESEGQLSVLGQVLTLIVPST